VLSESSSTGGVTKCRTRRSSEGDNNSGWLIDGGADAYDPRPTAVRRFSEGPSLTIVTEDSPGEALEGSRLEGVIESQHDAFKVEDYFETYVVYFTSTNSPLQRTMGKLSWIFGGLMVYDARVNTPYPYRLKSMLGGTGQMAGTASTQPVTYQGTTRDSDFIMNTCPAIPTPTPAPNPIDNSRFFVRQQYSDILNRAPDGAWLIWLSFLTDCDFDRTCVNNLRIAIARGFYESAEFRQSHPGFDSPARPNIMKSTSSNST
jgi:hypothetical protein